MAKRVLVPIDGSGVSESILPFLYELGNPSELEVILLQVNGVIPPMAIEGTCYFTPDNYEEPVGEILAAAREDAVDLIAMATHGRTGPARVLWGSVAEGVLRHAPVPVFLLRRSEKEVRRRRRRTAVAGH